MSAPTQPVHLTTHARTFPLNRWWIAGFSWELKDQPVARTLLGQPMVLFRTPDGQVAALQDRCCHKDLPLSCGKVEGRGLRCGYHGLLYSHEGTCVEIPGQDKIPAKAKVVSYPLREKDQILWVWVGDTPDASPQDEPPAYPVHSDPKYKFGGDCYHYDAPFMLIHENLLDLSHLGYVHTKTIGGNPAIHMNAQLTVSQEGDTVKVTRLMPNSEPPPTYTAAWPFKGRVDRWQEVAFHVTHELIWTGAMDVGSGSYDDPHREGFHMRGLHGVTPETDTTTHYFWTIATNPHPEKDNIVDLVVQQTAATFLEDKVIIEAQWQNQQRFGHPPQLDIHVDVGPNRAKRVVERLLTHASKGSA
ncbi:Rieske 2Fe-2S domain-containing protein [Limnohabitans sp.]|uniref:Rieske 2Fe-2S domain-containing protein n=1 Tax=Limnohabitans sp. TaxID=1907725 RepID=UPI0038B8F9AC